MARQNQMADNGAALHPVPLPANGPRLADHFPDGGAGHGKVVLRPGELLCQSGVGVFEVRQVDVHGPFHFPQGFHPFVASAVADYAHREPGFQGGQNGGQKVGGGHKVDVFRPLGNEVLKNCPQAGGVHGLSHRAPADGGVLAVSAPQGTPAEKYGAASSGPCQGRLLPLVDHGFGNQCCVRASAEAPLSPGAVHAAGPGAQFAVYIIHEISPFAIIVPDFMPILNPGFTFWGNCAMIGKKEGAVWVSGFIPLRWCF